MDPAKNTDAKIKCIIHDSGSGDGCNRKASLVFMKKRYEKTDNPILVLKNVIFVNVSEGTCAATI